MTEAAKSFPVIREAVASFPDREHFRSAVSALLAGGFVRDDLSVLASHDSLAVAEAETENGTGLLSAGLSDEIKYVAPLTVAGILVLSGGPIALTVAALVGAGLGGAALKELFDDYTASHHSEEFEADSRPARRCCGCAARTPTASSRQPGSSKEPAEPICMSMAARLGPTDPVARRSRGRR